MVEINSWPNNQDEYRGAEDVMRYLHGRTSGVFGANGNLSASAVDGEMAVELSDGIGWMSNDNADGIVWWNDAEKTNGQKLKLQFDVADGVLDRIDLVVVSWETTNYVERPTISVLKGTKSSNPIPPTLTNNSTMRQIAPYQVYIAAGTLSLTNSMITDKRLDPAYCGIVTEYVNIDTSTINSQFLTMLAEVNAQAAAILKSIQDELANLEAGTAVELKKLEFTDTVVPASSFVADTTYPDDYPYRAAVALDGVMESMIPDVTLSVADAISGNFAPVAESYNGGIYIYAASVPDADITIPTILLWRGNA